MAAPPGATRLDELAAEGDAGWALDALLWGGDMAASLQTLERSRGRLAEALGLDMSPAAIAAATAAATASTGAEESKGSATGASPASSEEMAQPMDTGETPLVSSAWLNWDNPRAATKLSAGLPEDTQELRRLKTRDAMRRSRQRQRDQLQQLRDAVAGLEKQYSSMCLVTDTEVAAAGRGAELEDAVALSKRLGAENLLLKASIQKQEAWRQQLSVVMESRVYLAEQAADRERAKASGSGASVAPSLPFSPEFLDPIEAKSVFGFRPLSDEDVKDLILSNSHVVKNVQKQLLTGRRGSGDDAELLQPVAKLDVFGWDVRQRVRGSLMEFVFTKRFTGVSISEIMHKTWVNEMQLKGMQKVKYDTKRLDILQEVNPNAYVIGREVLSPDATPPFRTTMVRYRMEHHAEPVAPPPESSDEDDADADALVPNLVASGYAIGICSINPDPEAREPVAGPLPTASSYAKELAVGVLWADLSYMIEFLSVADAATGQEQYVEVRWSGRTDYKSQFHAYRNTADKISTLLHWELLNIAPPVTHIISTSPRGER